VSRALIAIGVSRAPPLDTLEGAIADAKDLAEWARSNKYEHVHVLTDDKLGSTVTAIEIYDCCERLLSIPDLEQLLIFFSGHGFSPLPGHEVWLLSGWKTDANQGINVSTSVLLARGRERPRIAFIADACRDTSNDLLGTTGMVILPKPDIRFGNSHVDEFYATPFGDVSQQYQPAKRLKSYGVFSKELLKGLKGAAATNRGRKRVVTSRSLEDYLRSAVPKACAEISGASIQFPDARAQWQEPKDIYSEIIGPAPLPRKLFRGSSPTVRNDLAERDRKISAEAKSYQSAEGRESFETATGVTVVGADVRLAVANAGVVDCFRENDAWQIRVADERHGGIPTEPCTLMVQIWHDRWPGYWMAIPIFPELIATAIVDENGFSSLNYRAARRFRAPFAAAIYRETEPMLAEVSAMFRFGLMPSPARLQAMIQKMRESKFENPALAVIAAHICYRLGDLSQIYEMENYPIGRGPYTPYDFLLLTGRKEPGPYRKTAGHFPILSSGWGLLPGAEFSVNQKLLVAARGLAPSLWTFADPTAGEVLLEIVSHSKPMLAR
jgi:hypothetical protein